MNSTASNAARSSNLDASASSVRSAEAGSGERLVAGAVLVESIFAVPGVGRLLVDAVLWRDYPMIQGTMLFVAALFILVNAATDALYAAVDPRIRVSS